MVNYIDIDTPLSTVYCIPLWLRDEQVKINLKKCKGRLEPNFALRDDPVACVSYGPSLSYTWPMIKDFKYIMTCSGAHKFLIEKGIIPTWHVDLDPREHKIQLCGPPHKDVEYLLASTCHPKYFDYLADYNVKLWHIFSSEEEVFRLLPPEEWSIMGGPSVGLRTMTLARFMGFRDLHIFGMDGCEGTTGKHAAFHPNQPPGHSITRYKGKEYRVTPSLLSVAKATWHEVDEMVDCKFTFYGQGLVQEMAKDYKPSPPTHRLIGASKFPLFTQAHIEKNKRLHDENPVYGVSLDKYVAIVLALAKALKTTSVLDYGCGKGYLGKNLPFPIWEYDPAIDGKQLPPRPADIVLCTHVLEHIEPECLDAVLADLARCTKQVCYMVICLVPAKKTFYDGTNTHLIVHGEKWWKDKLKNYTIRWVLVPS